VSTAAPPLLLGAAMLGALVVGWGLLTWWLLLSPLRAPPRPVDRDGLARMTRIAILLYLVGGTAGIWDTVWHMRFGLFGAIEDFWWPTHIVIYAAFGVTSLAAFLALAFVLDAPGGLRARFRVQPLVGAFCLAALFQLLSGPSDQVWHRVHGADLTGWSLPHLLIVGIAAVALPAIAAAYLDAARPDAPARGLVATLPFVVLLWSWLAIAVGDWEFAVRPGLMPPDSPVYARPGWQCVVAGAAAGAAVLGVAGPVLGGRWPSFRVAATTLVWSAAVFLFFALLGSPLPLWTTPLVACVALAADVCRRRGLGVLASGALYGAVHAGLVLVRASGSAVAARRCSRIRR
jgi:hypothetical protein